MDRFAAVCDTIASTTSRLRKVRILAEYLQSLNEVDLGRAVRFLNAVPLAESERQGLSIGGATLRDAAVAATGYDVELIRLSSREVGDSAEGLALLSFGHSQNLPLSLEQAEQHYLELQGTRRAVDRVALLSSYLRSYRVPALKYFLKVITGNLRIGLQAKLVEEAIAAAFQAGLDAVRQASNRSGDLAAVALAARQGSLEMIEAKLFHPMDFMLAKPLDDIAELTDPEGWWVEDKYDGIRCQVHVSQGRVRLFTRGLEDVTHSYPDLVLGLAQIRRDVILDGELLAWRDERAMSFNLLQQRLARKKLTQKMLEEIPVIFMAYDILYDFDKLILEETIEARRSRLEDLFSTLHAPLQLSPQNQLVSHEDLEQRFTRAREGGNEGLVLKRRGSVYEAGKRGGAWLKVKRPYATLDVVVTAAEQGRGRRATMLSDYTFAVRDGDRLLNVGKAYSGLTDEEIRELTRLFRSISTNRFGRVLTVEPQVVLEVAFDGIQKSPRHKSGYAMRFPRIVRWRRDKNADQIDTLERVQQLYEERP